MAVARLGSRATAEANRIWGGVHVDVEKGGVHVIVPNTIMRNRPVGLPGL